MEPRSRVPRGQTRFWLLAVIGGVLTLAVAAGVVLAINLLLGRSLEDSLPTLAIAIVGLGPYIGVLTRRDRERRRTAQV